MWVIYNVPDQCFWSDDWGWTGLDEASRYATDEKEETTYLPGQGSIWVRVSGMKGEDNDDE